MRIIDILKALQGIFASIEEMNYYRQKEKNYLSGPGDNLNCRILKVGGFDKALNLQIETFDVGDVKSLGLTLGSPGGG